MLPIIYIFYEFDTVTYSMGTLGTQLDGRELEVVIYFLRLAFNIHLLLKFICYA